MSYEDRCLDMAKLAGLAYLDGPEAKPKMSAMGYSDHKFLDTDGAQCHAIWNDSELVLCFRGTEPDEFSDIKADLNALPDRGVSGGWVHNGFQTELEKLWEDVSKIYDKHGAERDVFITGHSLGGAMATLAASRLKPTALFTYGSPRAGTRSWKKSFNTPHYRHVNNNDIVPKVPFAFLGYTHHGTLRYINFYGNIRKMTTWQRFKDGWRGRIAAWKNKQPFDGARDHGMNNYIKYLEKQDGGQ